MNLRDIIHYIIQIELYLYNNSIFVDNTMNKYNHIITDYDYNYS